MSNSYVLLCRHGRHDGERLVPADAPGSSDQPPIQQVADRLRELLSTEDDVVLTHVFYAATPPARATARALQAVLGGGRPAQQDSGERDATPTSFVVPPPWAEPSPAVRAERVEWSPLPRLNPPGHGTTAAEVVTEIVRSDVRRALASRGMPGQAVILVGHSPHLEQLGAHLQRRRVPTRAWLRGGVAIQSSELVCLRGRPGATDRGGWTGRLAWQICPDDSKAEEQIRDKIKSKMDAAKQLGAVSTLLLTALLGVFIRGDGWQTLGAITVPLLGGPAVSARQAAQIAFVLLLLSLGLQLAAMYAYDSLLMPSRFWTPSKPGQKQPAWLPKRPPGSAAWVLHRNMQRTWAYLFQPGAVFVVAAFVVVAVPLLQLTLPGQLLLVGLLVGYIAVVWWFRPVLGTTD